MKRANLLRIAAGLALAAAIARGQRPEPLSAWEYFKEIPIPPAARSAALLDFVLDVETLDKSRTDQADLRLYNASGREIPYVLRIRREIETSKAFEAREFDRGVAGDVAQISFDLGESPQQHNELEIATPGENFRRLVEVEGSDDRRSWSKLTSQGILFRFSSAGRTAEQKTVPYPVSRYRYLRARVRRDPEVDRVAPEIKQVNIRRSIRVRGETAAFPAISINREATRADRRAASAWRLDFGGRIPIERLVVTAPGVPFSRPYRLEVIDTPTEPVMLSSSELVAREDMQTPPAIGIAERFARHLKLTITDDRNAPLSIVSVMAQNAARQVTFESARAGPGPVKLYYGNHKAPAPHYDLAARVPVDRAAADTRVLLGPARENPIYQPEPKPLTERSPWLVYLVLAAASIGLAAILLNLARAAKATIET